MEIIIKPINKGEISKYLSVADMTASADNNVIKQLYQKIKKYIENYHNNSSVIEYRLNPIVDVKDNFDNLLIENDNLSRSSVYTHYVTKNKVLRTQTSAQIPMILKELSGKKDLSDVVIMLPGLVYRRDVTDKKHLSIIHQVEIWRLVKREIVGNMQKSELLNVIKGMCDICAPDWKQRNEDKIHPYTLNGIEINLIKGESDIEILEGGIINPKILQNAGIDSKEYTGWAMGLGLDRLVMILKDIPDIRYLRSSNPKIAAQMQDLKPYIEVSTQPSIKRDMSYCVPCEYVEEDIHQEIREALGVNETVIESIEVMSETSSEKLGSLVREKLGCTAALKNILVRVTLRHLEKTLTKVEANDMYKQIYSKVNYGKVAYC